MGKSKDNFVRLATIAAAHGIKGDVKLIVFTADPLGLSSYGKLFDENGRSFKIDHIRKTGNAIIVHFSGLMIAVTPRRSMEQRFMSIGNNCRMISKKTNFIRPILSVCVSKTKLVR